MRSLINQQGGNGLWPEQTHYRAPSPCGHSEMALFTLAYAIILNKLVGLYSPFDVVFCSTGYDAYSCRGHPQDDALAVASNIVVFLTDRTGAE